ncbi:MAG: HAMP domain-containing histidine kinase [Melioribacteraceae bacterium]|nr:HAMP domain-containing histidine kinase [Melioribacteraceae bacterium]
MNNVTKGISLKCNFDGYITEILFNNISKEINEHKNQLFVDLFDSNYIRRALDFFVEIKRNSVAFSWELPLNPAINEITIFFSGVVYNEEILIIASEQKVDFSKYLKEMMIFGNEQINQIRGLEKEKYFIDNQKNRIDSYLFDKLSILNNELVDMQRELTKANNELKVLNEYKNRFIGMAAHDLRNPLHNIMMYVELFKMDYESSLNKDQIEMLDNIYYMASFMHNLVNDLLDVSNLEYGNVNLRMEKVDIEKFFFKTISFTKNIAIKKNIRVNISFNISTKEIEIDKEKINQVVTNLLTNAIKFSYPDSEINIYINEDEQNIIIAVKDNGQGIEQFEIQLLFQPFKTTSTKSTQGEKSTGLGLYISKRIIEAHKGKIWVESKKGEGATFFFTLPKRLNHIKASEKLNEANN